MKILFLILALVAFASPNTNIGHQIVRYECFGWRTNTVMISENGCHRMEVNQLDGNLMVTRIRDRRRIWQTNVGGQGGDRACLQGDGNFVLQRSGAGLWGTATVSRGRFVQLANSAEFFVRNETGWVIWRSSAALEC